MEATVQAYNLALERGRTMLMDTSIMKKIHNVFPEIIDAGDMITADSNMLIEERESRAVVSTLLLMLYEIFTIIFSKITCDTLLEL